MHKTTFTLIEMTLVTAVGLILLSVLMPSFKRVLMRSQILHCQNTLRNLGALFDVYSDSNRGIRPAGRYVWNGKYYDDWKYDLYDHGLWSVHDDLGYLKGGTQATQKSARTGYFAANTSPGLVCPAGENALVGNFPDPLYSLWGRLSVGALYDAELSPHASDLVGYINFSYGSNYYMNAKPRPKNPAAYIQIYDLFTYSSISLSIGKHHITIKGFQRHAPNKHSEQGYMNYLFFDGHVEAVSAVDFFGDPLFMRDGWQDL